MCKNLKTLLQDALQMLLAVSQGHETSGSPTDKSSGMYLINFLLQEASNGTGKQGHSALR